MPSIVDNEYDRKIFKTKLQDTKVLVITDVFSLTDAKVLTYSS
jgi:hypothetical protein